MCSQNCCIYETAICRTCGVLENASVPNSCSPQTVEILFSQIYLRNFTTDRYERLTRSCCDGTDKIYQVFVATVMCYAHRGRDRQELSALRRNRDRQRVVVDLQVYMYALGVRVCYTFLQSLCQPPQLFWRRPHAWRYDRCL